MGRLIRLPSQTRGAERPTCRCTLPFWHASCLSAKNENDRGEPGLRCLGRLQINNVSADPIQLFQAP